MQDPLSCGAKSATESTQSCKLSPGDANFPKEAGNVVSEAVRCMKTRSILCCEAHLFLISGKGGPLDGVQTLVRKQLNRQQSLVCLKEFA